ncbi:hypothetical protein KJA16_01115 [Patescibacteria group bacterium]|nr:hypothetical protein [Patescibacteria group bacterium]
MFNSFIFPAISRGFLLQILGAFLVFIVGLVISWIISKIVRDFLNKIRLNRVIKGLGWKEAFARAEIKLDMAKFFGEIAKWLILIIFLMAACEIVELSQFSQLLGRIVDYFPNILVASLIFIVTVFLVDFTYRIFLATTKKTDKRTELTYSRFLGVGARRAIWVLATLAILYQLQIVPDLILSLFIAILGLLVLACGIAFGLGGKEIAKKILEEWKEKLP